MQPANSNGSDGTGTSALDDQDDFVSTAEHRANSMSGAADASAQSKDSMILRLAVSGAAPPGTAAAAAAASGASSVLANDGFLEMRRANFKLAIVQQLQQYKRMKRQPLRSDPLLWWRDHGALEYDLLAPIARRYLSVLCTSADVERVFSCAKRYTRDERGRTSDSHVDMLTCLHRAFTSPEFDPNTTLTVALPAKAKEWV